MTDDAPADREPGSVRAEALENGSDEASRSSAAAPKKPRRWGRRLLLEGGAVAAVYYGVTKWRSRNLLDSNGRVKAPAFNLKRLNGPQVSLASLHGSEVLIHFWATW